MSTGRAVRLQKVKPAISAVSPEKIEPPSPEDTAKIQRYLSLADQLIASETPEAAKSPKRSSKPKRAA